MLYTIKKRKKKETTAYWHVVTHMCIFVACDALV